MHLEHQGETGLFFSFVLLFVCFYFDLTLLRFVRSNLRPGSAGPLSNVPAGRPLGVIPPLSSANSAPERPHSNTSLSSSDSAPGSTVSSSRSSSRDPLPPLASFPSIAPTPPIVLGNSSTVSFNGQPPASKPPYGMFQKNSVRKQDKVAHKN